MTTSPKRSWVVTVLVAATIAGACEKNSVQVLPTNPPLAARIKFFNFGVNAPGVNFYADATKMTAILSATGTEATTGVAYGAVGNGGAYSSIAPASYTLTAKIAATVDKDLAVGTTTATIVDGKFYSWYLSGFYNTTAKTIDGFVVEDPPQPVDYTVAQVRLVHAISNASPLNLYRRPAGDTLAAWVLIQGPVSYKTAGAFTAVPMGIYDLSAGYPDSTTKKIVRTNVTLFGGHAYSIGARGDITITSTTATNRPFLDNTPNF